MMFFFFSEIEVYNKKSFAHYLLNGTLGKFVVHIEADLQLWPCRVIFGNPAYGRNWLSQHFPKLAPHFRHFFVALIGTFNTSPPLVCTFWFLKIKIKKKSNVMCDAPWVTCHMSCVKCHMSHVTCHLSLTPRATTTYFPLITPQSSAVKGGQDSKISKR